MTTPKTGKGGGGGGGSGSTRRGRKDEMPVVIEPTANNKDNDDSSGSSNNNNSNNTAVAQKTGGCVSRLPSIKERRPSVQKKARTVSVTEVSSDSSTVATATTATTTPSSTTTTTTTTTTILQRQESTSTATTSTATPTIQRRSSVNQGLGLKGGRPTFAGIGRRVSSMVRARMAFQSRRKSVAANAEEVNHMEAIHEMPRNPRFTTFLSAEAQYAMMKGYEDMLYEKIAKTNPESRLVLKRTKTPFHKKISIVDNDNKEQGRGGGEKNRAGGSNPSDTTVITTITATSPAPTAAMSPDSEDFDHGDDASADSNANRTTTTLPSPFRKAERSQSTVSSHVSKSMTSSSSPSPRASGGVGFALHRSSSLPTLKTAGLSHQRRLVLTYRLESAMDILDTLKHRNKENSLSPRVYRIPRQVDAVKDFNSWTKVWNKEFKVAHAK